MKTSEAENLVAMIGAACKTPGDTMNEERTAFWVTQLEPLDAELATKAALDGTIAWEFFPSWSDFARLYQGHANRRRDELERTERNALEDELEAMGRLTLDGWVKRWIYARYCCDPPDLRVFPEQEFEFPAGSEQMPADAYVEEAARMTDADAVSRMIAGTRAKAA